MIRVNSTVHSFDPCIAGAIHLTDDKGLAVVVKRR
jgi:Ni,Fe-hydrogenase I large subunit